MKKLLVGFFALALLACMAAPAEARRPRRSQSGIRVRNENWIGWEEEEVEAEAEVGDEEIMGNAGFVFLDTLDAVAGAYLEVDKNSNETYIDCACVRDGHGGCNPCVQQGPRHGSDGGSISVSNSNGVDAHETEVEAEAEVGEDEISGNAGSVTVYLGGSSATATGFVTVNSNVTRIGRRLRP